MKTRIIVLTGFLVVIILSLVVVICPVDDYAYVCFHCRSFKHAGTFAGFIPYSWTTTSSITKWYLRTFPKHSHNWCQTAHIRGNYSLKQYSGVDGSNYSSKPMWIISEDGQKRFIRTASPEQLANFDDLLDSDQYKAIDMIINQFKSLGMHPR